MIGRKQSHRAGLIQLMWNQDEKSSTYKSSTLFFWHVTIDFANVITADGLATSVMSECTEGHVFRYGVDMVWVFTVSMR
jgi:hypothetical protein